eukprot:TRINITY_DN5467_c0_g1_i1.p2 TRINITY_DN5467_c0_g1~~TRINITY_DN5467_c0_g1_i1.p2  ORF type:complete len:130 (-),score=26.27 TRINITY_DN5467_c0_g1_i1:410-799(-)
MPTRRQVLRGLHNILRLMDKTLCSEPRPQRIQQYGHWKRQVLNSYRQNQRLTDQTQIARLHQHAQNYAELLESTLKYEVALHESGYQLDRSDRYLVERVAKQTGLILPKNVAPKASKSAISIDELKART